MTMCKYQRSIFGQLNISEHFHWSPFITQVCSSFAWHATWQKTKMKRIEIRLETFWAPLHHCVLFGINLPPKPCRRNICVIWKKPSVPIHPTGAHSTQICSTGMGGRAFSLIVPLLWKQLQRQDRNTQTTLKTFFIWLTDLLSATCFNMLLVFCVLLSPLVLYWFFFAFIAIA